MEMKCEQSTCYPMRSVPNYFFRILSTLICLPSARCPVGSAHFVLSIRETPLNWTTPNILKLSSAHHRGFARRYIMSSGEPWNEYNCADAREGSSYHTPASKPQSNSDSLTHPVSVSYSRTSIPRIHCS